MTIRTTLALAAAPPLAASVLATIALAGCALQQPLPRNLQPVIGTPIAGTPNLHPTLSPAIIQDDFMGRPPESLNSLPPGAEVNNPLAPQAGQLNSVRVGPSTVR